MLSAALRGRRPRRQHARTFRAWLCWGLAAGAAFGIAGCESRSQGEAKNDATPARLASDATSGGSHVAVVRTPVRLEDRVEYLVDRFAAKQDVAIPPQVRRIEHYGRHLRPMHNHHLGRKTKLIRQDPFEQTESRLSFRHLKIGPHDELVFSIGIWDAGRSGRDGVRFRVEVGWPKPRVLFEHDVTNADAWHSFAIDLHDVAGDDVTLHLVTQKLGPAPRTGVWWAQARIVRYQAVAAGEHEIVIQSAPIKLRRRADYSDGGPILNSFGYEQIDHGWLVTASHAVIPLPEPPGDNVRRMTLEVSLLEAPADEPLPVRVETELLGEGHEVLAQQPIELQRGPPVRIDYAMTNDAPQPLAIRIRPTLSGQRAPLLFVKTPVYVGEPGGRPNVILISLDTLRPDHLSLYGYQRPTSPFLDRFGAENFVFQTCYAQAPCTMPSHASLLMGTYPTVHQIEALTDQGRRNLDALPLAGITDAFKSLGYHTVAFTGGGNFSAHYGFDRAFDLYAESLDLRILDRVKAWLRQVGNEPFFLVYHTYEIHDYYDNRRTHQQVFSPDYRARLRIFDEIMKLGGTQKVHLSPRDMQYIIDLYDGAIRVTDRALEDLAGELKRLGLYDDTWVFIVSDHGESFGERHADCNLWHHGGSLYEEQVRVPLIIKPGRGFDPVRPAPHRIQTPVSNLDVAPTIYALLGLPAPEHFAGHSLLPLLGGEGRYPADSPIYTERVGMFYAAISGNQKALYYPQAKLRDGYFALCTWPQKQLYDLHDDPGETVNLFPQLGGEPAVASLFAELLRHVAAAREPVVPADAREVGREQIEKLRALGYLP